MPESLETIRSVRRPVRHVVKSKKETLNATERFAMRITRTVGSMSFFFALIFWTIAWLLWNMLAPASLRFDPAPAFVIWIFISNMLQLILLPLIMVGQNIEGRAADKRAQADFEIDEKSEKEIETILEHLENQQELLLHIAHRVDRK